ncbi:MAG TPA: hypothetical protein VNQ52_02485 [Microbacteriaceae bacterium]|nr:hypothetical protein [Microbacteriaceae bacterium]
MAGKSSARRGTGFSLTELLIVVLIVIVLAGIGIAVTFSAQQGVADAKAKANVGAAVEAIGRFAFANDGVLPTQTEFLDGSVEFPNLAPGETGYVRYSLNEDSTRFCVHAEGDGEHVFVADNKLAATLGTCIDGVAEAVGPTPTPTPVGDVIGEL